MTQYIYVYTIVEITSNEHIQLHDTHTHQNREPQQTLVRTSYFSMSFNLYTYTRPTIEFEDVNGRYR